MAKRDYSNWTKEQLIDEVNQLKKRKKYGLVWEDKPEDVVLQCQSKLPVLAQVKEKEIKTDPAKPTNILIEGDNYHALSVLNYTHKGKIDVIYIDPPYNTGNKDFVYNDHYVDREDGYRHSKWLSFMANRLNLAKKLLKKTGVIFISIDDNEQARLKILCDRVFGEDNFIANMIWQSKTGASDAKKIDITTEYVLVYAKSFVAAEFAKNKFSYEVKRYRFKDSYEKERGMYYPDNLDRGGLRYSDSLNYAIICPDGTKAYPNGRIEFENDGWTWKWGKEKVKWGVENGYIEFKKNKNKRSGWAVYYKNYMYADNEGNPIERSAPQKNVIFDIKTGDGTLAIKKLFGDAIFKYPKPVQFIERILNYVDLNDNSIVLDFMAGSGTTGHAVLEMNKKDGRNIKFILCTNNELNGVGSELVKKNPNINPEEFGICRRVAYKRLEKVIRGHKQNGEGDFVEGLGGNLKYYKTDFVPAEPTDQNKIALTQKATEMLCVKEDAFDLVKDAGVYKIFRGQKNYAGIVFDQRAIADFKKEIAKINAKFSVYIFSLGDDDFSDEFADFGNKAKVFPIPEVILETYRAIFKIKNQKI